MTLGFAQPLNEMSTRWSFLGGKERSVRNTYIPTAICEPIV
jgi:hypothetical protein